VVAVLVVLATAAAVVVAVRLREPARAAHAPNIVLLLTDDQRPSQLAHMPQVHALLAAHGITFARGFTPDPLCCPSRISILRGQLSQRTGVWATGGRYGGFAEVHRLGLESSTVATWLHGAGYRTALIGKYLNGYDTPDASWVPPGWDYWRGLTRYDNLDGGGYYDYGISVDGVERRYGSAPSDYSTTVLTGFAHDFITGTPADQPLFMELAYRAPHRPSTPAPRYLHDPRCAGVSTLHEPGFDEADVSDKPLYIQRIPRFSPVTAYQAGVVKPRKTCRALLSVDDSVAEVMHDLAATGRLSNTMVVFMSDNGILFGEHRWQGKKVPYWQSTHVPFIVRFDPMTAARAGTVDDRMVENVDLAPTWAALAGVTPPIPQDGRSLVPLLDGRATSWRSAVLLQGFDAPGAAAYVPGYCGVETASGWVYVHYDAATEPRDQELYDLHRDPGQLHNLAYDPAYAARREALLGLVRTLCVPGPPGFSW